MTTKPHKKTVAALTKQASACKERIAKERDKLRAIIADLNEIEADCDEAIDDLDSATDALSRYL